MLRLFFPRGPPAILRLVVPAVVDSVQGQLVRVSVGQRPLLERRELVPFLTDRDPAGSVVQKVMVPGVVAPFLHVFPDPVQPRGLPVQCLPVLVVVAPATANLPFPQIGSLRFCESATVTLAKPHHPAVSVLSELFRDGELPESLTDQIHPLHLHPSIRFVVLSWLPARPDDPV